VPKVQERTEEDAENPEQSRLHEVESFGGINEAWPNPTYAPLDRDRRFPVMEISTDSQSEH
jgi:hypothetical protein